MMTIIGVFFSVLISVLLLSPPTMAEATPELQVVQGNGQFTQNLYKVLSEEEGNVFFSPISVHAVLSMAYQGAQGSTAECFASALKIPDASTAGEGYNTVMNRLNNVPNVTLLMANKVYLKEGYELIEAFNTAVTKKFLSEVELLDFGKKDESAKAINDWVKEKTRDKIQDLIKASDLDELTRLVLVNAIYFKGNWLHKFNKELTRTEPFYLNSVDKIDVEMMHIKRKFDYKADKDLDAQVLRMPYTNEDLSMIIILPNQKDGIHELEKKLETYDLSNVTDGLWNTEVNVGLPRFKIETTIDLKNPLIKLGLGEIFDEGKANFKGILSAGEQIYVSKVVQKAFIEVNEEGAEAAAATVAKWATRSGRLGFRMIVDHPFIIQIVHSCCGSRTDVLFQGRISQP